MCYAVFQRRSTKGRILGRWQCWCIRPTCPYTCISLALILIHKDTACVAAVGWPFAEYRNRHPNTGRYRNSPVTQLLAGNTSHPEFGTKTKNIGTSLLTNRQLDKWWSRSTVYEISKILTFCRSTLRHSSSTWTLTKVLCVFTNPDQRFHFCSLNSQSKNVKNFPR